MKCTAVEKAAGYPQLPNTIILIVISRGLAENTEPGFFFSGKIVPGCRGQLSKSFFGWIDLLFINVRKLLIF